MDTGRKTSISNLTVYLGKSSLGYSANIVKAKKLSYLLGKVFFFVLKLCGIYMYSVCALLNKCELKLHRSGKVYPNYEKDL